MTEVKESEIESFIKSNDKETIKDYLDRLWANLDDLNKKEEKHSLWFLVVIFLYLVLKSSSIESFNIGPITFKDISIISKILPLIFVYIFFNLRMVSSHKKDINFSIKIISENLFKQPSTENPIRKEYSNNLIIQLFLPYSFSNSLLKSFTKKPRILEAIIGFPLLLPVLIIGLVPYIITILMLSDLWNNYTNDTIANICFWITLWAFLLNIFYTTKAGLNNENN